MKKLVTLMLAFALVLLLAGDSFARGGRGGGSRGGAVRGGGGAAGASFRRSRTKKDGKVEQERVRCEDRESIRRRAARHRRNAD